MPAGRRYACRGGVARGVRDCTAGTSKSLWEFEREPIFLVEKSGQKWGCRSCPKMECVFALKVVDLDLILAKTDVDLYPAFLARYSSTSARYSLTSILFGLDVDPAQSCVHGRDRHPKQLDVGRMRGGHPGGWAVFDSTTFDLFIFYLSI